MLSQLLQQTQTNVHTFTLLTSTYSRSQQHFIAVVTFQTLMVVTGLVSIAVLVELGSTNFTAPTTIKHQTHASTAHWGHGRAFTHSWAAGINLGFGIKSPINCGLITW